MSQSGVARLKECYVQGIEGEPGKSDREKSMSQSEMMVNTWYTRMVTAGGRERVCL